MLGKMQNHYRIAKWALEDFIQAINNFNVKPDESSASKAHQAKAIISQQSRQFAQSAMEALGGYSYFKKVEIERLYRDLLAGEFHPMLAHKQEASMGEFLITGKL